MFQGLKIRAYIKPATIKDLLGRQSQVRIFATFTTIPGGNYAISTDLLFEDGCTNGSFGKLNIVLITDGKGNRSRTVLGSEGITFSDQVECCLPETRIQKGTLNGLM